MKTLEEIKTRARAMAEMHYYADVDGHQLWEPFENYPDEWIADEIESMTDMLVVSMRWAQSK